MLKSRIAITSRRCRGFTLIELLVVIFIIAVLIALLLPAILSARESANRTKCRNNLHQLGLALHNYESAHRTFPIGVRRQVTYGPSWFVGILPFVEQENLYSKFNMTASGNGWSGTHPATGTIANGWLNPQWRCPSSDLPEFSFTGGANMMLPSYEGIMGAASIPGFTETRVNNWTGPSGKSGISSGGGMMPPNTAIKVSQVTDGTTNTMFVGECSDYAIDPATGAKMNITGGVSNGWTAGTLGAGTQPGFSTTAACYNVTTIRYPPNTRDYSLPGIYFNRSPNNPLNSPHTGGVNVLMVDGTVRMISDNINMVTFGQLATRDDGQLIGDF